MQNLLLGASVAVALIVLFMIYKLATLINVAKGSRTDQEAGSNNINAILMLAFLIIGGVAATWSAIVYFDLMNMPVASEHGVKTDSMFWITMWITGAAFVITHILLFYFAFKYRYKKDAKALYYPDNHKLELIWTIVPAVVLTILIGYGLTVWNDITDTAPEQAEVVEVMGAQFAWRVRYPGADNALGKYDYRKIDDSN
ncbi:Alternative cytochrome c oxidase polypeptide CoxM, partial [hydrothermal vent metagenome]